MVVKLSRELGNDLVLKISKRMNELLNEPTSGINKYEDAFKKAFEEVTAKGTDGRTPAYTGVYDAAKKAMVDAGFVGEAGKSNVFEATIERVAREVAKACGSSC